MEKVFIERTKISPEVTLDFEAGFAELNGESYPENSVAFYKPVFNWLNEVVSAKKTIQFNFKLTYFNTSSSKSILDIIDLLEQYHSQGGKINAKWFYKDEDMQESGEEFSSEVTFPFELLPL